MPAEEKVVEADKGFRVETDKGFNLQKDPMLNNTLQQLFDEIGKDINQKAFENNRKDNNPKAGRASVSVSEPKFVFPGEEDLVVEHNGIQVEKEMEYGRITEIMDDDEDVEV
jgi:hypothetical protein